MVCLKKGIEYLDIYWDFANTFNPLSANPRKWSNTLNYSATVDECGWPFCGVGA